MGDFAKLDSVLEGSRKGGASLLPTPVSPAWYDPESKSWYGQKDLSGLSKSEKQRLTQCSMLVQYSPTSRASCRRCGMHIQQGQLRFGYPFRWREAEDCYSMWLHPECYVPEVFGIKEKELRRKIFGYEALNNTERARLWKAMKSEARARQANREGRDATDDYAKGCVGPASSKAGKKIPSVKVPKELTLPMLPFQQEGLSWMCHQEDTASGGGILADEMGMGKTIQAIGLLLSRRVEGPCLVVCPMAAVPQWASEIERFTKKGALKTLIYHGQAKARLATEFKKVDVVITTYQTLETDYRRETNKNRVTCKWCGKLFQPEKLAFHQRYFCGPDAIRTAKQQKTDKKHQDAAKKAMASMGIGGRSSSSTSGGYTPPTITNIYKDFMKQAGVDVKAKGYWNVMREASARQQQQSASSSSTSPPARSSCCGGRRAAASATDGLNRERLTLLERSELQDLADAHGVDTSGRKAEIIDRLMDFAVTGKVSGKSKAKAKSAPKAKAIAAKPKAKAKAKSDAMSKLKPRLKLNLLKRKPGTNASSMYLGVTRQGDKFQASYKGKYLGRYSKELDAAKVVAEAADQAATKGGKGSKTGKKVQAMVSTAAGSGASARTVAAARSMASKAAEQSGGKCGSKRKTPEADGEAPSTYKTYDGPQINLKGSPLHAIEWSRIILDEAHRIKGRTNSTAMAAYALRSAGRKWCLTGTPIQNRVGELYSLIRFLRVRPYAFYYCNKKGCNCECSRITLDRYCPNCGHIRFMHFSHFRKHVSAPIIKYGYLGAGKSAFNTLRNDVLDRIMLRRTKEERKKDLHLPPIKVSIRKDKLSKEENDFYSSLYMQSSVKFDTYVQNGTMLHNYAHIFDLLTSLRRAVDHPYLIVYGGRQGTHKLPDGSSIADLKPNSVGICGLCQDDIIDGGEETKREAKCGHCFHDDCIRAYIADAPKLKSGGVGCPVCFTKLHIELDADDDEEGSGKKGGSKSTAVTTPMRVKPKAKASSGKRVLAIADTPAKAPKPMKVSKNSVLQRVKASEFKSSTKIEALVDEVQKMTKADKTAKAIAFSQFGVMLELVEFRLKRAGISCVVFRGGMSMQARQDALVAFNSDPTLKVILISLKAGGEGLNLQVANHVFLLDPWWNPACELQAIQRAHRIGQTREVKAVRFITAGTIEEKIVQLQEKKQLVFDSTIDGSATSMSKLTEQDLRFLFQQ